MISSSSFPRLTSPAVLSPMAGVTDVAFRALAKQYGAGLTCTEFVSSTGLVCGRLTACQNAQEVVSLTELAVSFLKHEKTVSIMLLSSSPV